ncbi:MAG: 4-(cytidine 5'-diphospho)-2-C-methyl-D-erythritol kinase [Actinomycetota bacterium]
MATVRLRAHAKINLYLRVLGAREDGYHEIETILHSIDFADYLELRSEIEGFKLVVRQDDDVVGTPRPPSKNLVQQAAELLQSYAPKNLDVEIGLAKRIPVGAGLGGGSADAAATLIGLARLHELALEEPQLHDLAAQLGADVPFFLFGGTALATGYGERIAPLDQPPRLWFVLGMSRRPLLTEDVYRAWDEIGPRAGIAHEVMVEALRSGALEEIGAAMRNDLEQVAIRLRPELRAAVDLMESAGAVRALVSGSGPTVIGLCKGPDHARSVGAAVRSDFDRTQVTCSQARALEVLD